MKKNKTKLKALTVCLIIITAVICVCAWAAASEPHGAVTEIYTDSGGGSYTLYADGHLHIEGYAGGEPEEGVLALADRVKSMELNDCVITAESRPLFKECASLTRLDFTDTSFEGSMREMFSGCKNLEAVEFSDVSMSAVTDAYAMFRDSTALKSIDLSGMDFSGVKNMQYMFQNCTSLESANLSGMNLTSCNYMVQIFERCNNLKKVDMSNITASDEMNAYQIFTGCRSLETADISGFNFGKTSLYYFFHECPNLREVNFKEVDTSNVTAMNAMFIGCEKLKTLDLSDFDTGNVVYYHDMFSGCTGLEYLDVSGFDLTDTGSQMERMFDGLVSLREINLTGFKTSGVTVMYAMFKGCKSLERLDLSGFDTSSVTNVTDMFTGCTSLKYLNVSGFDLSKVSNMSCLFMGLSSLERIDMAGFKVSTERSCGAYSLFDGCKSLKYLDLSETELKNAVLYQAFNNVGFWELRLPETSKSGFPCFGGNTPPEKPYYTWDGDWSYYIDGAETAIRDDVLQSSKDAASPEQICLDTVRIQNAGNAIRITPNFTPIEYPVNIRFTDTDGNVLATESRQYSIEDKAVFSALDRDYAEKMCPGYGLVGFTSEKLGITGAGEVTAPEVPCGDIEITVLMKLPEPETEPETTTEPKTEPETTTEPESPTEPPEDTEPAEATEPEMMTEAETTSEPETATEPESSKEPAETTEDAAVTQESVTLPEESKSPHETEASSENRTEAPSKDTAPETVPEAVPDASTGGTMPESPEDTTKPQESTVNTGDSGSVFAVIIMGAAIVLFFIIWTAGRCIHQRKRTGGRREKKQM